MSRGGSTGTDTSEDESKTEGAAVGMRNWSTINWVIIATFSLLTVLGMGLSIGLIESIVVVPSQSATDPEIQIIPMFVYLYSGLGALGYVFTKLMGQLEDYTDWGEIEALVSMALRIPAAWILAAGVYLFLGEFSSGGPLGARFVAGVSFLVGLYVNVTMKALGSLADRILGRATTQ